MSKINAIRLINLNYNNNAIKVSDETFHMNGQSTLLALRNGGGKSVLVQMMMAPFIHKRYRDAKDRPFESYFTTGKPTFILVEWVLDQGAGYVLTGLMVRRSQEIAQEGAELRDELEIISIISEYQDRCIQDIHHLPVVEKTKKEITLKNFGACRQLFETYKRDRSMRFFCYDLNNSAQSRQYFEKLKEYQINYKEWETIIKKVNLKESGLSDLFSDCRDEKGLVEKWFLDAVESKLDKEKNRMREFQTIIEKYVEQYKENRSKIKRRDTILRFCEEGEKIRAEALRFREAAGQVRGCENRIAGLIAELARLQEEEERLREQVRARIGEIREQRERLNYEKLSGEIHQLEKEERFCSSNRDMIDAEREALASELVKIKEKLHLLECAKQQQSVDEDERSLSQARQKAELARQKGEALEPERRKLGYSLKQYYGVSRDEWLQKQDSNAADVRAKAQEIHGEKQRAVELQDQIVGAAAGIAELKTKIRAFDQRESLFNRHYGEKLARNILGEYEPGALGILLETYEKEQEELARNRVSARKQLEVWGEEKRKRIRDLEDIKQESVLTKGERLEALNIREQYERELKERRTILRYLELGEDQIFQTEKILAASDHKLKELQQARRALEQEEDQLKKEYVRLTQGKILELPGEFAAMLEELGIHYVYGMEWMKKNGRSSEENRRLAARRPFLPYALILSEKEFRKLANYGNGNGNGNGNGSAVYTSFPIPIILREQLEDENAAEGNHVINFDQVRFYVYFNQNLLDEEALMRMIREKEQQLQRVSESISQKQEEYTGYFERREKIRNQQVNAEKDRENRETIRLAEEKIAKLEEQIGEKTKEQQELEQKLNQQQKQILLYEQETQRQNARLDDFKEFSQAYDAYLEDQRTLEHCRKQDSRLREQKKRNAEQIDKLESQLKSLEYEGLNMADKLREVQAKCVLYEDFDGTETLEGDVVDLEGRFLAITSGLSLEQKELERQAAECRKRYEQSREELHYLQNKYQLPENGWKGILYSRKEEQHQEVLLEDRDGKKQLKDVLWNEEDKKTAVLRQQISEKRRKMLEECKEEEPLPMEEIATEDFEAQINQLLHQEKVQTEQEEAHSRKISGYEGNLTSLAEYAHLVQTEETTWPQALSLMNRKQLDTFKGEMVRDYRRSMEEAGDCRARLVQLLNRILRIEVFQEDFYRKPLEALLELSKDAGQVLVQLDTTVQSYQSLMEKLEVDISMVEKEKKKIVELLEDYLRDVHENLGKIDANSTITIRERPIKMLKIQIPDWQENEALYQLRISDFMDEITRKGIERFEQNENAQEYFGTQLTTRNLYDTVVGISNVQIRLYKIEAQREYPITWADVAKNSGGEGFLSAFVILSSLLYYMRRDDSDFFADRNEGKVLVMDNPFAQTNAAHLLKPLMDMADKTNTQLICLSGLGGDTIYNRFDNIYVLNLITASLRSGIQYVRTDHMKGLEGETVIPTHIEVTEQMELMF